MMKFVYVSGMRGPTPELWHDVPTTGAGVPRATPLQSHELEDRYAHLSLNQLSVLFPFKGETTNAD